MMLNYYSLLLLLITVSSFSWAINPFYVPPDYRCPRNLYGYEDSTDAKVPQNCTILYEPLQIVGSEVYLVITTTFSLVKIFFLLQYTISLCA